MADETDLPLGDQPDVVDEPLVITDEPVAEPTDALAADAEPEPEPEPPISREADLARERDSLRQYVTLLEERVRLGHQAPPPPQQVPDFFQHMTPEQKAAWEASYKTLEPALAYREQRLRAEFEARQRLSDQRAEVAELRGEYGDDFLQHAPQLIAARQQIAQQGGGWLNLGDLYLHLKGQEAVRKGSSAKQQRVAQTTERRRTAARAAQPTAAAPAGVRVPAPAASPERIKAMSDDEILDAVARAGGPPRLKVAR